jgi:hypothetical protein
MTVENSKGEKEVLTDYQSFAAGYRSAVMDLTGPHERMPILPIIGALLVFLIMLRVMKVGEA